MDPFVVEWRSPAPLWNAVSGETALPALEVFKQPSLLRFATDSFMEDFVGILEKDPSHLPEWMVQPETWHGSTPSTLKLYQPAHQRYYLVTSTLVCRQPGLPDLKIDPGRQDRVSFVVRRLFPPGGPDTSKELPAFDLATWDQYAYVKTPEGSRWQDVKNAAVSSADELVPGEELNPLFAVNYTEDDGRKRRLFAGLVPAGNREAFMGAGLYQPNGNNGSRTPAEGAEANDLSVPTDPRMYLLRSRVIEPWKSLIDQALATGKAMGREGEPTLPDPLHQPPPGDETHLELVKASREQIQTASWYILLDFANFLRKNLSEVWDVVSGSQPKNTLPSQVKRDLVDFLDSPVVNLTKSVLISGSGHQVGDVRLTFTEAIGNITNFEEFESRLERVTTLYNRKNIDPNSDWPDFLFPLADPLEFDSTDAKTRADKVDKLEALVQAALPAVPKAPMPAKALATQPVSDPREGWFVIRCVFERPECGPFKPPVVSEPTQPFQLASFFDPDAPARPIRIALPLDTSPAGLRKFDKNATFMISDMLCGQINGLTGLTLGDWVRSVLPWPLYKKLDPSKDTGPCADNGNPAGMMCTLSIPIVTVCALILLMIIVKLFDTFFRWLPFFITCFRLPGMKAKA